METLKLTSEDKSYLKGYANALQDLLNKATGYNNNSKHYDPIDFKGDDLILSYAFDFKNGGRKHPVSDYTSLEDIANTMLEEFYRDEMEDIIGV